MYSDPLVTKLDFDKEPTPGRKHYPAHHDIREPLVQDKLPDKEEVQVTRWRNWRWGRYVMTRTSLVLSETKLTCKYRRMYCPAARQDKSV